jgi:hypothetical protein
MFSGFARHERILENISSLRQSPVLTCRGRMTGMVPKQLTYAYALRDRARGR